MRLHCLSRLICQEANVLKFRIAQYLTKNLNLFNKKMVDSDEVKDSLLSQSKVQIFCFFVFMRHPIIRHEPTKGGSTSESQS